MKLYGQGCVALLLCLPLAAVAQTFIGPSDGLQGYYALDGNVNDGSGRGQNGTAFGGVTYIPGVLGSAANLNGNAQYIALPGSISVTMDLTVAFWLRTTASTPSTFPSGLFLVSRDIAELQNDWNICLENGRQIDFHTGDTSRGELTLLSPDLPSGQWVHVAVVANSAAGTKTIYLNGQAAASTSWVPRSFDNNGVPIDLGLPSSGLTWHSYFPGDMDELYIYNRALSGSEILTLVPEPSTAALLLMAGGAFLLRRASSSKDLYL